MASENEEKKDEKKDKKEAPPKAPGLLKNKKLLLIIGIVVAVLGVGAGVYLLTGSKSDAKEDHEAKAEDSSHDSGEHGGGHGEEKTGTGSIVALDPFIVNLQDNSGTRYLKLTINLEMNSAEAGTELNAQSAKIKDSLIILLSSKSYADIGSVEGKYQMRDEIIARVNQYLTKGKVKTAYFTDLVIQ